MGKVFRARDRLSGSPVAVKVLLERRAGWDERFTHEAETLSSLSHPGIVRHVAHGESPSGERYLVMEWLEGEELSTRLARGALTVEDSLSLAAQVADALACAHQSGVVHRDLKPGNLWLVDGKLSAVKVLDFGVARTGTSSSVSHAGTVIGTPGYMAPEQVRGKDDVDARADVFALGCVLFECLTGKPLFWAEHVIGILAKILLDQVPSLRALHPHVPAALDALLLSMLAKAPDDRPAHGGVVCAELKALRSALQRSVEASLLGARVEGARAATRSDALSERERRTLALVLVGSGIPSDGSTPNFERATPGIAEEQFRRIVQQHGGHTELLVDGTAIITFERVDAVATDQAAQAARCALALCPVCPARPLSVVTSRADVADGSPLGHAIDSAAAGLARSPARAAGGPIALDALTAHLLDARFEIVDTGAGHELAAERRLPPAARLLLGKPTDCVGRELELASLMSAFATCIDQRVARGIVMSAAPGMGKSRLASEFVARSRETFPRTQLWLARADPLRAGSAFATLAQALRGVLELAEGESTELGHARIQARVALRVPLAEQRLVAEFLGELVGCPFGDRDSARLRTARRDAQIMNAQLLSAWLTFVRVETAAAPVLFVLEDLHWSDLPSVRFIEAALRSAGSPLLVVALARPEVHQRFVRLWAEAGVQHVHLRELSPEASERLVRQGLGASGEARAACASGQSSDAREVERVVALADGNAFYLEELTRALADLRAQRAVRAARGDAHAGATTSHEMLPETVLAMVEARLNGLDDDARRVLRAASVFGEVFWESGLLALLGSETDAAVLHGSLRQLLERELLVARPRSRFGGERELAFRHALLREGAYARLTEEDKKLGHRVAADWLEGRGEVDAVVLAAHLERGDEPGRAAHYYVAAAKTALSGADLDAVIALARRGLACGVSDELALILHTLIITACGAQNELAAAQEDMVEVQRLAPAQSPLRLVYELAPVLVQALRSPAFPDVDQLTRLIDEALSVGVTPDTLDVFGSVVGWALYELDMMCVYHRAEPRYERYVELFRPLAASEATAEGWAHVLGAHRLLACADDPWGALAHAKAALRGFQRGGHHASGLARTFVGMNLQALGAYEEAYEVLQQARDSRLGPVGSLRDFLLVVALLDADQCEEAHREASRVELSARSGTLSDRGRAHWALGIAQVRIGALDDGDRSLSLALVSLSRWPVEHLSVLLTRATVQLLHGQPQRALSLIDAAAQGLGSLRLNGYQGPLIRYTHLRRAEVLAALGRHAEACREIAAACARVLAIADTIASPEYRSSFLERVPHNQRALSLAGSWLR